MRVFIYACENTYQGLHGICDMRVVDVSSLEEANEYGMEMSEDVIQSYDIIDESLDEEEYEEAFLEARLWYIYPIDEEKAMEAFRELLPKIIIDHNFYEDESEQVKLPIEEVAKIAGESYTAFFEILQQYTSAVFRSSKQ